MMKLQRTSTLATQPGVNMMNCKPCLSLAIAFGIAASMPVHAVEKEMGGMKGATMFKEGGDKGGDKKGATMFKEGGDKGGDKKGATMFKEGGDKGGGKKGATMFKEGGDKGGDKKGSMLAPNEIKGVQGMQGVQK